MKFTIGEALDPQSDDESFTNELAAVEAAREWAQKAAGTPIAVWEMKGCEIVRLMFNDQEFKPC